MTKLGLLAAVVVVVLAGPTAADERVWTDTQGRTMRAEFVREVDGEVTFLKDGKLVTLPLTRLSDGDQQVVRDLASRKAVPEPPSATAPARPLDDSGGGSPSATHSHPAKRRLPIADRVWSDVHGNQVTAKFVRMAGGHVVLRRGTRTILVPFRELTSADQEYVRELLTSRGQGDLLPPAVDGSSESPQAPATSGGGLGPSLESGAIGQESEAGPSLLFEEMRRRDEEQRLEREQETGDSGQETVRGEQESGADAVKSGVGEQPQLRVGTAAASAAREGPQSTGAWDAETVAQAKEMIIIGLVVVGVIGIVGFIVWVAITIASRSSVSRQRRYS